MDPDIQTFIDLAEQEYRNGNFANFIDILNMCKASYPQDDHLRLLNHLQGLFERTRLNTTDNLLNNPTAISAHDQNLLNIKRRTSLEKIKSEEQTDKRNSSSCQEVKLTIDDDCAMDVDNICLESVDTKTNENPNAEEKIQDAENTEALEKKMLYLSFSMRAKILIMGTDVWTTKAKFTNDIAATKSEIEKYIKRAEDAYNYCQFQNTDENLTKAEKLFDEINVIFQPVPVESNTQTQTNERDIAASYVKYKVTVRGDDLDVMKCIQLAEDCLSKGNIKRAERLLLKAERICPTKNARQLLKKVEAAKLAAAAETAIEAQKKHKEESNENLNTHELNNKEDNLYSKTTTAKESKETEPIKVTENFTINIAEPISKQGNPFIESIIAVGSHNAKPTEINQNFEKPINEQTFDKTSYSIPCDKMEAKKCEAAAKEAFENKDYNKAKKLLRKAQRMDKEIDVTKMLKQVECELFAEDATKSSRKEMEQKSDKTTNESRYGETRTYPGHSKLVEEKVKKDKIAAHKSAEKLKTEIGIKNKQSQHDHSKEKPVNGKYGTYKVAKDSYANIVAKPSYEHSCSEYQFALSPGKTAIPSYHLSNNEDQAENYLKKAKTALTQKNFDLAEEYATKSEELNPSVRAKSLLDDIAHSRNNCSLCLRSGTVYKTLHQNIPKSSELKNKAEKYVEKAEKSYIDGKIEEAELLLRDAESLHPMKRATVLSELIQEAKKNPEILENLKKEKAKKHVKEAGEFYSTGDLDTAESLLVEANNIYFTKKIQDFLEKIRHEKAMKEAKEFQSKLKLKPEEKFDQREQEAIKCVNMADIAMAENNIEKAERLLAKAMRLHPSKTTQDCLETVLIAKEKIINEEAEAAASAAKEATATEKESHEIFLLVNSFVNSGLDAYNEKKYYAAEEWFKKAYNVHPTDLVTYYLLRIKKMIPGISKKQANPSKEKEIIDEQDIYLTIADKNLKDNNLKDAFANVLKAENLRATDKGYQLLLRILEAEYYKINGAPQKIAKRNYEPKQMRPFKAKRLLDVGEKAFSCKHFQMAEYYFRKSSEMFPSVKAKTRKLEAEQAKKKNAQEGWTVWGALKGLFKQ